MLTKVCPSLYSAFLGKREISESDDFYFSAYVKTRVSLFTLIRELRIFPGPYDGGQLGGHVDKKINLSFEGKS